MAKFSLKDANARLANLRGTLQNARATAEHGTKTVITVAEVQAGAAAAGFAHGAYGPKMRVGPVSVPTLAAVAAVAYGAMNPRSSVARHGVAIASGVIAADVALMAHDKGKAWSSGASWFGAPAAPAVDPATMFVPKPEGSGMRQIAPDGGFGAGRILEFSHPMPAALPASDLRRAVRA